MSYLDRPNGSSDALVGALLSIGAASATGVSLLFIGIVAVQPMIILDAWMGLILGFFFGMVVALVVLLLVGLPATFILRRLGAESAWTYGALGAASGLAPAALILFPMPLALGLYAVAAVAGGVGGVVWWRGYRRHFHQAGDRVCLIA